MRSKKRIFVVLFQDASLSEFLLTEPRSWPEDDKIEFMHKLRMALQTAVQHPSFEGNSLSSKTRTVRSIAVSTLIVMAVLLLKVTCKCGGFPYVPSA